MDELSVFCVSYDLRAPGRNYEDLYNAIRAFGTWWHQTESVWLIASSKGTVEIRDYLTQFTDSNDKLFVIEVKRHWAGKGFNKEEYDWLKDNLK